jgi:hypothetical protein
MAVISFGSTTINAAQDVTDATAALQAYYANNGVPTPTLVQIQEYIRQENIARLKGIVRAWRAAQVVSVDPVAT